MAEAKAAKKSGAREESDTAKGKVDAGKRRSAGGVTTTPKKAAKASSKQAPKDWDHVT